MYFQMNGYVKRFQEYATSWDQGEYETPLVALENITEVPMALFTATKDNTCHYDVALEHIARIGSKTTRIDVEGYDHDYFDKYANSDWFMEQLVAQLQVPETSALIAKVTQ